MQLSSIFVLAFVIAKPHALHIIPGLNPGLPLGNGSYFSAGESRIDHQLIVTDQWCGISAPLDSAQPHQGILPHPRTPI